MISPLAMSYRVHIASLPAALTARHLPYRCRLRVLALERCATVGASKTDRDPLG